MWQRQSCPSEGQRKLTAMLASPTLTGVRQARDVKAEPGSEGMSLDPLWVQAVLSPLLPASFPAVAVGRGPSEIKLGS